MEPRTPKNLTELDARIINHSREVFFSRGFNSVTMDEIANDLGISKKTLYQRFSSKKKLLETILIGFIAMAKGVTNEISTNEKLSLEEKIKMVISVQIKKLNEIKPPFIHDLRRYAYDIFEKIKKIREEMLTQEFRKLITDGVKQGKIRRGINKELFLKFIISGINGAITPDSLDELNLTPGEAFEQIFTMVFVGISKN